MACGCGRQKHLASICQNSLRQSGKVDEQLLTCPLGLPHGAFEALAKAAVVLVKLEVAPRIDRVVGAVQVGRLGAAFFPEQGQRHAFGAQFLENPALVVGGIFLNVETDLSRMSFHNLFF